MNNIFKVEIYSFALDVHFKTKENNQENNDQFCLLPDDYWKQFCHMEE